MLNNSSPSAATCFALKEKPLFWEPGCTNACTTFALLAHPVDFARRSSGLGDGCQQALPRVGSEGHRQHSEPRGKQFFSPFFTFRCHGLTGGKLGYLSAAEARAGRNNSVLKKAHRAERPRCPPPSPSPLESHECTFLLSRKGKT